MIKRLLCALLALVCLLSQALAEETVISVDGNEITRAELKQAVRLELFLGALQCTGYGYALDIVDPLTIEDEMDKVIFALEDRIVIHNLAAEYGIALDEDDLLTAREDADAEWQKYRDIAFSDNGMAFLPAGNYEPADDPEETVTRYFASFGLTYDALLERSCDWLLEEKLKAAYTKDMDGTEDELLMAFVEWQLEDFGTSEIIEDTDAIIELQATLWDDE